MPPARSASASAAPRRQTRTASPAPRKKTSPAPRKPPRLVHRPPKLRVRWERVGRVGLLLVLAVVVGLYVEHALAYLSTRAQADQQQAVVQTLTAQNARLTREQHSLNDPATIIRDARALGMVRPGEEPYVILGSPGGR